MALQVYDTLRRGKIPFEPMQPGRVGMYVCGMTVQGAPHVGHMRAFMTADLMRRVFRARGFEVTLVQNFTDIDDKIIEKAAEAGMDTKAFADRMIEAYFEAADWMGIERATHYPRATEHIREIQDLIARLIGKGHAYASGGDVFFAVTSKEDYGKLSGKRIDELRTGVRIEVDEDKRHPVDFALWKAAKPGEPAWESPWGPGRPGWHIECSAMAMKYLGETIDLHGGSRDLVFPHHENELAQSEAATGCPFCRHWVEGGLVNLGGQKMSKSTGIAFNVADVRNEVDPVTLRLYLLSTHYRSPIEYGKERLAEAGAALERIRNLLRSASHAAGPEPGPAPEAADLEGLDAELRAAIDRAEAGFHEALDDDFNAAGALGRLFELVREANSYVTAGLGSPRYASLLGAVRDRILAMGGLLGLDLAGEEAEAVPAEVRRLAAEREEARLRRDWGQADSRRDRIRQAGFAVEDRPDGPLIRPLDETADSQA
jgi:cysteinyl-tRNA synthetase